MLNYYKRRYLAVNHKNKNSQHRYLWQYAIAYLQARKNLSTSDRTSEFTTRLETVLEKVTTKVNS